MKTNLFDVSLRLQKFSRIQSYSFQLKEHTKFMSCLPGASMNYFIRNKLTYISCSMPPHYTHLLYHLLLTMFYRTRTDSVYLPSRVVWYHGVVLWEGPGGVLETAIHSSVFGKVKELAGEIKYALNVMTSEELGRIHHWCSWMRICQLVLVLGSYFEQSF